MQEDNKDKNTEKLIKEKYDRERKEEWKNKIPMPSANETKPNVPKLLPKFLTAACVLLLFSASYFYFSNSSNSENLIDQYIEKTPLAALDENVTRSAADNNTAVIDNMEADFIKAAMIVKEPNGNLIKAINELKYFSETKNKYQLEALWFKALAHAKLNEKKLAIQELNQLQSISNYQKEKVSKLIQHLK